MKKSVIALVVMLFLSSFNCFADSTERLLDPTVGTNYADAWHFYLTPYLWMAGENGYFKIRDKKVNLNTPIADLRHDLDFGGDVYFEVSRAAWSFYLEPAYVKVTQDVTVHDVSSKASQATTDIDGGAYYLLLAKPVPHEYYNKASLELLGGARIMSIYSAILFYNNAPTVSDSNGFIVPIVGARVKYNFHKKLQGWINADIGGFHITHVSNTWSATLGFSYNLSKSFALNLAYKALGINYYKQSDSINTLIQGPMIGASFTW
jgi:opacity protein-like surface antigen